MKYKVPLKIDNTNRMETFYSISVWKSTIVSQKMETFISLFLFYCFLCCVFHVRHICLHHHCCPVVQFYASLVVFEHLLDTDDCHSALHCCLVHLGHVFFMLEEARLANINFKAISFMTHIPMGWMLRTYMSHKCFFITASHFTNWTLYLSLQQHWTLCRFLIYTGNRRWCWTIRCSRMHLLFDDRQVMFSPVSSQVTDRNQR